jgi:hypothetical protein
MYIAFEGILGMGGEEFGGVLFGTCACEAIRLTPSGTAAGRGGGKGEMEMAEMDAA